MRPPLDKQLILDSLVAIARGAGRPPSRSEFIFISGISEHQVSQFFPTWNDAVRAAGLRAYTLNVRLKDRELLEDWAMTVRAKRKIPARRAYRHLGQYDPRTFERRFGPWSILPQVFRNFARGKPEWADVLAILPRAPKPARPVPANPVAQVRTYPNPVGRPEALPKTESHHADSGLPAPVHAEHVGADFSPSRVPGKLGLRAPSRQSLSSSPAKLRHPPLGGRPTYGQPMDFRGLRYEPVNEQGVVLLFGMVARELGYRVEAVQSGFPDCEAQRQIGPQRWQRVHIEFEFESRNFRDHGHPHTGCDVIVCWRHNWPNCPAHIEILELSSLINSLPTSDDL